MKRVFATVAVVCAILMTGCKGNNNDPDDYTTDEGARDGLYDLMDVAYFWRSYMPEVDLNDYTGPYDLLEALRYTERDKWSFVADFDEFISSMEGDFVGHGIRMGLDTGNVVRVVSLYNGSDMWPQGVRRGWIVDKINNVEIAPIFIDNDSEAYYNLMGSSTAGVTNTFYFIKPDGDKDTIASTKASFTVNSVLADTVFDRPGGKIGYLCFDAFLEPSASELNESFAKFNAQEVSDLIVDLRYNTGGYLSVAQQMASQILDESYTDNVCYKLNYNSVVGPEWNETFYFIEALTPLSMSRVVFITTRSTASASEVVINSLKPYISVSLVGDTTHGKPVGMNIWGYPFNASSSSDYIYVFAPVTFEYVNANDEGQFYEGMVPDLLADDDITRDFGDTEELSVKAALSILEGTKAAPASEGNEPNIFTEGKQLPHNLINDVSQDRLK